MHETNRFAIGNSPIESACQAIRDGDFDRAVQLLQPLQTKRSRDGFAWNLLGVAHEQRREWKEAKHCYGRAIAVDPKQKAAQQNMRRIYELTTFGASNEAVALSDHEMLVRKSLDHSQTRREPIPTPN